MPPAALDTAPASLPRAARDAVLGIGLLCLMDALVKAATARYPVVEVAFLRFAFGALAIGFVVAWARPRMPNREALFVNFLRALLVVNTAVCFFYAISVLPLAEATALSFLAPVFMAVFAAIFLGERITGRIVAALAIGFAGMLVIVLGQGRPADGPPLDLMGVAAGLASAVSYALVMVFLRARATKDGIVVIVALQNLFPALLLAAPASLVFVPLAGSDVALFAAIGVLGAGGHLLLARAFRAAEAAKLASVEYTALVWASLLGYALFSEVPGLATWTGAGLIVVGAVVSTRR